MGICDSEENRKKLAWLVPGYILLAWFFCVLFQPLGIHTPPGGSRGDSETLRSSFHSHDTNYEVIYLDSDRSENLCNGGLIMLEQGSKSAIIIRLNRHQFPINYQPFNCSTVFRLRQSA